MLCLGAGLLVDRLSGGAVPAALFAPVGAALLIGVSQWTTYLIFSEQLTLLVVAAVAAGGAVLGRGRVARLVRAGGWRASGWPAAAVLIAYVAAAAPVIFAGRVTFAAYNVLPDSALHMIGADYLLHHGQHYAGLDRHNSYGQYIAGYFGHSYPSGSHTLFGASALLVGLSLIWALQPFCACMLALSVGPAWLLARGVGLRGPSAAAAALTASVPALVYGFGLVASIKELVALPLILTLGGLALTAAGPPWRARAALPFGLVAAAGVSALGVGFGAWALAGAVVLAVPLARARAVAYLAAGVGGGVVAAWPTWVDVGGSLRATEAIAGTPNPGNLYSPLHATQIFGTWLASSYRSVPGAAPSAVLIGLSALAALAGAWHLARRRTTRRLACWIGLGLAIWAALTAYGETWTDAKLLMLTSPIVVLLAWAGVAGLRSSRLAAVLAVVLAGGILASDFVQYRDTDLAPSARYAELASLDGRFGPGPTLIPDFDEWSLYVLRRLDVGGPSFVYRPPAIAGIAAHHGDPVDLDLIPPAALAGYRLIVTARDPLASRPPAAYRLLWAGTYYEVWGRRPGAPVALAHVGAPPCASVGLLAAAARSRRARLVAAVAPPAVRVDLVTVSSPLDWRRAGSPALGLQIRHDGTLRARFVVPSGGAWNIWLRGEVMPSVRIALDGRPLATLGGQIRGSVYNPDTLPPVGVSLAAGRHVLTLARSPGLGLGPGDGGTATLQGLFLTPAAAGATAALRSVDPRRWRSLCARPLAWVEVVY